MHFICTSIGHATNLLQVQNTRILTDPHFGMRSGCSRRRSPLHFDMAQLKTLSACVISRIHPRHFDPECFRYLTEKTVLIAPEGSYAAFGELVSNPVIELNHYSKHTLPDGTEITALPTYLHPWWKWKRSPSTANSYLFRWDHFHVYFCAASGFHPLFSDLGTFSHIDIALLPVGGRWPRFLMRSLDMTPQEVLSAMSEVRARHMIPISCETFASPFELMTPPLESLQRLIADHPSLKESVHLLHPGETLTLETEERA